MANNQSSVPSGYHEKTQSMHNFFPLMVERATARADIPLLALSMTRRETAGELLAACLPLLRAEGRLYCLDGGNVFDPRLLATRARACGFDPLEALERVMISRSYTCHQLAEAARAMLLPLIGNSDPLLVAVLGVDHLFVDEDISYHERAWLYGRIVTVIEHLSASRVPLVVTFTHGTNSSWARRIINKATLFEV